MTGFIKLAIGPKRAVWLATFKPRNPFRGSERMLPSVPAVFIPVRRVVNGASQSMRCYFMRKGHIAAVELLEDVVDDSDAIKRGGLLFLDRIHQGFEGFEIWERDRVVFRYPEEESQAGPTSRSGSTSPSPQGPRKKRTAPSQAMSL